MIETVASLLYDRGLDLARDKMHPRIAVINGIHRPELKALADMSSELVVQQQRRDTCLALQHAGYTITRRIRQGSLGLVLVLAGRQREQTLGWLAEGARALGNDGLLALCAANDMGARGYEKRFSLLGALRVSSKAKCRFSVMARRGITDERLLDEWLAAAAPRRLPESGLVSCPGVFCWDRTDVGSHLLLEHLPQDLSGCGMDLGCGNGYLSRYALLHHSDIREWHAVDVDAVALDCAEQNLQGFANVSLYCHWLDATSEALPGSMDVVLMNPPFHKDRADSVALGQAMITAAMRSLKPSGRLFLVANRHLPYELQLYQGFAHIRLLFEGNGYKVLCCEGVLL